MAIKIIISSGFADTENTTGRHWNCWKENRTYKWV